MFLDFILDFPPRERKNNFLDFKFTKLTFLC